MNRITRIVLAAAVAAGALTACESDADKVSTNLSKDAEQFKVVRRIVGINGITDKVEFLVEGRCSIETPGGRLDVVCKEEGGYKKHFVGLSDNMFYIATQLEVRNVSTYRTKIIIKPENIVPDFDLVTGSQP